MAHNKVIGNSDEYLKELNAILLSFIHLNNLQKFGLNLSGNYLGDEPNSLKLVTKTLINFVEISKLD